MILLLDTNFNIMSNRSINFEKIKYARDLLDRELKDWEFIKHFKVENPIRHQVESF